MLWAWFCQLLRYIPNQRWSQTGFLGPARCKSIWGLFCGRMCHRLFSYLVFPLPKRNFSLVLWSWELVVHFGAGCVPFMTTARYVKALLWDCPCLADPRPWFLSTLNQMFGVVYANTLWAKVALVLQTVFHPKFHQSWSNLMLLKWLIEFYLLPLLPIAKDGLIWITSYTITGSRKSNFGIYILFE